MKLKIWVKWISAFFESGRATSVVIRSIPGYFLRGKDLMQYCISPRVNGLGMWSSGRAEVSDFSIFLSRMLLPMLLWGWTTFERYEQKVYACSLSVNHQLPLLFNGDNVFFCLRFLFTLQNDQPFAVSEEVQLLKGSFLILFSMRLKDKARLLSMFFRNKSSVLPMGSSERFCVISSRTWVGIENELAWWLWEIGWIPSSWLDEFAKILDCIIDIVRGL